MAEVLEISLRTLARRREAGRLTTEESERFNRLVEIHETALRLFNGVQSATRAWI